MPWQRAKATVSHANVLWILRNRFPSFLRNSPVTNATSAQLKAHKPKGLMNENHVISNPDSPAWPARAILGKENTNNARTSVVALVMENARL